MNGTRRVKKDTFSIISESGWKGRRERYGEGNGGLVGTRRDTPGNTVPYEG